MARIFISHASANNEQAVAMQVWLASNGWDDVFLDLDPERGLVAGERWLDALKAAAHRCEAVLVLVSEAWLASKWCQAEMNTARMLGKRVLPVLIEPIDFDVLPADMTAEQIIDQTGDPRWQVRLKEGLENANLAAESFPFAEGRRPYPGLEALTEQDAAIFFGREAQIVRGLDRLRTLKTAGIEHLMVILGASGAGKSSFLRAGLWPRLKRDDRNFLPLPVIRPERAVLTGSFGLARALAQAFADEAVAEKLKSENIPITQGAIEQLISHEADGLSQLLSAWREAARIPNTDGTPGPAPTVVLPIDQGEELFAADGHAEADRFLDLLGDVLTNDPDLIGLIAIRSDAYPRLQTEERLAALARDPSDLFSLGPMPEGSFRAIIEGPAKLVSPQPLELDPQLTEALLNDATGSDALPLLAFTLERLYIKYGMDGDLKLSEYQELGGIKGAIEAAVNTALDKAREHRDVPTGQSELEQLLRSAFIPHLVDVSEADHFVRRVAPLDDLEQNARPLIDLLVDQHLLIKDRRGLEGSSREVIEVAHEALLREWPLLSRWLEGEKDALRAAGAIARAAHDWHTRDRSAEWLVHQGERLVDAETLAQRPDMAGRLGHLESEYLIACRTKVDEERKRQETQRRRFRQLAMAAFVVISAVAGVAGWQWYEAKTQQRVAEQRQKEAEDQKQLATASEQRAMDEARKAAAERDRALRSQSRRLAAIAEDALNNNEFEHSIRLARYALIGDLANPQKRPYTWESAAALIHALSPFRAHLWSLPEPADAFVAFIADGTQVLTVQRKGSWSIWDMLTGKRLGGYVENAGDDVSSVAIAGDEPLVLIASSYGARLWNAKVGGPPKLFKPHDSNPMTLSVAFSRDHKRVLTGLYEGPARVWDIANGLEFEQLRLPPDSGNSGTSGGFFTTVFAANDTRIITGSHDRALIWEVTSRAQVGAPIPYQPPNRYGLAVSADGKTVVIPDGKLVRLIDVTTGATLSQFDTLPPELVAAAAGADGLTVPEVSQKMMPSVWRLLNDNRIVQFAAGDETAHSSPLSLDRTRLLTLSDKSNAIIWDAKAQVPIARLVGKDVQRASFNAKGTRLVTGTDRAATIWTVEVRTVDLFDFVAQSRANKDRKDNEIAAAHCTKEGARFVSYRFGRGVPLTPHIRHSAAHTPVKLEGEFKEWRSQRLTGFFTIDGSRVVLSRRWNSRPRIFDATSGAELTATVTPKTSSVGADADATRRLAVSPGERLTVIALENRAEVRRPDSDEAIVVLRGHSSPVTDAAFSSDGARIVTASLDGTARIWETLTGNLVDVLDGESDGFLCANFTEQDDHVITASARGLVRRWDVSQFRSFADVMERARLVAPRDLSEKEKKDYALSAE